MEPTRNKLSNFWCYLIYLLNDLFVSELRQEESSNLKLKLFWQRRSQVGSETGKLIVVCKQVGGDRVGNNSDIGNRARFREQVVILLEGVSLESA